MPSNRLVPSGPPHDSRFPYREVPQPLAGPPVAPFEEQRGIPWARSIAALKRFKWLVLGITVVGSAAGFAATRLLQPEYEVDATIWISSETGQARNAGPIRSAELLNNLSWPELVSSFAILDNVARKERLYLLPARPADSLLFADFSLAERFLPGQYRLEIDESGRQYTLRSAEGQAIETAAVGDSIGRQLGFVWTPAAAELTPGRTADFTLRTPRHAAVELRTRLDPSFRDNSNLMRLRLRGTDATRLATTMNTLLDEFVTVAADLKKRNLVEFAATLSSQLTYAERELRDAEIALENFRVSTITLPSEGGPVTGGVELTRDPVFANYFSQKVEADNLRRDRELVAGMLAEIRQGTLDVTALLAAPAVRDADALRAALSEYATKESQLRMARVAFTDEHRTVRDLVTALDTLRVRTIPRASAILISQLQRREDDLHSRITAASRELRDIPTRTIEEMRLRRNVDVRAELYTMLKNRYEEARLADVSSTPDVSILDPAIAPLTPTRNTAPRILLMAVLASIATALALVLILDRIDRRFRYPEQATHDLGLDIVGAVPRIPRPSRGRSSADDGAQIVEAFRTIRLNLQHSCGYGHGPVAVTVASPGADDGKSLVCANLALSFADAGFRTLLIDGDIRRGQLHAAFSVSRNPGLVDYLAGEVILTDVLRASTHERLTLLTCGSRRQGGPELLTSSALPALMNLMRAQFDAIVVDSAPLGAGIDAFVLGTITSNMLIVLRSGETDRRLAQAKLELVDRLPIRIVGAVLNDVPATGPYEYYSYLPGYRTQEDEALASAGSGGA
jgi:capsular exopolysaccharide synthesis family protein